MSLSATTYTFHYSIERVKIKEGYSFNLDLSIGIETQSFSGSCNSSGLGYVNEKKDGKILLTQYSSALPPLFVTCQVYDHRKNQIGTSTAQKVLSPVQDPSQMSSKSSDLALYGISSLTPVISGVFYILRSPSAGFEDLRASQGLRSSLRFDQSGSDSLSRSFFNQGSYEHRRSWLQTQIQTMIEGMKRGTNVPEGLLETDRLLAELQALKIQLETTTPDLDEVRDELARIRGRMRMRGPIVARLDRRKVPIVRRFASQPSIGVDWPPIEDDRTHDGLEPVAAGSFDSLKEFFDWQMRRFQQLKMDTEVSLREEADAVAKSRRALLAEIAVHRNDPNAGRDSQPFSSSTFEELRKEVIRLRYEVDEFRKREVPLAKLESQVEEFETITAKQTELLEQAGGDLKELGAAKAEMKGLLAELQELRDTEITAFSKSNDKRRSAFLTEFQKVQSDIESRKSEIESELRKLKAAQSQQFAQIQDEARVRMEPLLQNAAAETKIAIAQKLDEVSRDLEDRRSGLAIQCQEQLQLAAQAHTRLDAKLRKADEVIARIETSTDTTVGRIRQLLVDSTAKRDDLLTRFEKVLAEAMAARDAIIEARDEELNKSRTAAQIVLGELAQQLGKGKLDCENLFSQCSERLTQEIDAARLRLEKEVTGSGSGIAELGQRVDKELVQAREQFEAGVRDFIEENKGKIEQLFDQMEGNLQAIEAAKYACVRVRDQLTGQGAGEKS